MRLRPGALARDLTLAGVVLLTRLPFLGPGAGNDTDGWYLVNAAREIAATGHYTRSRAPGYPVQEWLASWIVRAGGGPVAINLLSAVAAAAAAFALARVFRRLGAREAVLTGLAFAFAPAAYVASVSAMDYLIAVAFLLAACDARLAGRNGLAAVWLGLAIGTRLTTVVLTPAVFLLPAPDASPSAPSSALASAPARIRPLPWGAMALACVLGGLSYVPAWMRYGWRFLSFVDPLHTGSTPVDFITGYLHLDRLPFPPALVLGQATALLWGIPGTLLLVAAFAVAVIRRGTRTIVAMSVTRRTLVVAALAVALEELLYVRLPHDEGYLLPAVPFVLLLAAALAPLAWYRAACVAVLVSPFVLGVDVVPPKKGVAPDHHSPLAITRPSGAYEVVLDPLRGPILQDHDKRVRAAAIVSRVIAARDTLPPRAFVWAGVLFAELANRTAYDARRPWCADYLGEHDLRSAIAHDTTVFLLPDVRERVIRLVGYDPVAAGARPLLPGAR